MCKISMCIIKNYINYPYIFYNGVYCRRLKAYAHTRDLVAIIRETPDPKSSEKKSLQILEIWKSGYLYSAFDLQKFDKHGKVYCDGTCLQHTLHYFKFYCRVTVFFPGTFGCLEFSPDDKSLVYLAEKKESKKQSYLHFGLTAPSEGTKVVNSFSQNFHNWAVTLKKILGYRV